MIIVLLILSLISFILLLWQISNFVSVFSGSPHVKTQKSILKQAINAVDLKKDQNFYELGSGSGDILVAVSKFNVNVIGFEISPYYYLYSKLRTWRYPNINIKYQNLLDADLSNADVVYCYLLPSLLKKLAPKFKKLKKNARVISIGFPLENLKLSQKIQTNNHAIYIYHPKF